MAATPPRILILKADRLYAAHLRQRAQRVLPPAQIDVVTSVSAARQALAGPPVELFIGSVGDTLDGDALDLIARCAQPPRLARHVLVVALRSEYRTLAALRTLPIDGVFDPTSESPAAFSRVLQDVLGGLRYWSPGILEKLQQLGESPTALFRILTDFEQMVLSVIGSGCDDSEAAEILRLSPSTIASTRRDLHRKLGVQHRGDLVRVAAQKGYVRFTPEGVERPGFEILSAAYQPRDPRRRGLAFVPPATA